MAQSLIVRQTQVGDPIVLGDRRILPVSRSYRLSVPGLNGGIIWNRPAAVAVVQNGELSEVIPIRDATRQVQLGLILVSALVAAFIWLGTRRSSREGQPQANPTL
jgi:hypothetical protein